MSETILVTPPEPGNIAKDLSKDPANIKQETLVLKKASENDIQIYFFTLTNTLKNYERVKSNRDLFKNTIPCDKCYQMHTVEDDLFKHETNDIILCDMCYSNLKQCKSNYYKMEFELDHLTGLKTY